MHFSNSTTTENGMNEEVEQLKAKVAALEELLEVYQQSAVEKSDKLEEALEKVQEHAQQLERSEQALYTLKSMLDCMGDGILVADENGKFVLFNPAAEKLLGIGITDISPDEWAERYSLYLPDKSTPYPTNKLPLVRAIQGDAVDAAEIFVRRPQSPEEMWISVNARPLKDENGVLQGGVAVFRDITNRKQSEEALRQQSQQLEQAFQNLRRTQSQLIQTEKMSSLGQLVAGVAHEINNPVNFIYG
ncbi:MAG TPA: PAS domain S-box protein, partial [Candidatus Obscuribacterales bacterium]